MASSGRIDELRKKFDENPRRYFAPLANEYRKVGDLNQAILICQEHLPQQPGHMSGHIVYGQALFEAGRLDEARSIFETALTLDPENLIALRHLGDIARAGGNAESAKGWYRRVLEADPRNEEIAQIVKAMEASSQVVSPAPAAPPSVPSASAVSSKPAMASAPTAELSVDAIQQLATARAAQTDARQSGARVMPAIPLDSLPTLVPGVPRVPAEPATPPPARPSSRQLTPLDWTTKQDTPATGSSQPGLTGHSGDRSDLLDLPDISLGTPPRAQVTTANSSPTTAQAGGGRLDLDMGMVFEADPLAIATRPAESAPSPPTLEGLEPTSLGPPSVPTVGDGDVPLLDVSLDLPTATPSPRGEAPSPPEGGHAGDNPDAASAQPAPPFVTTTMAELYVRQGHLDSAVEIYKQLVTQRPADADVVARLRALEVQLDGVSTPAEEPPQDIETAPRSAGVGSEESTIVNEPEFRSRPTAGPTIREFLLALIAGGADRLFATNGAADAVETWGSIDALFGGMPASEADAAAAHMLSLAFDDRAAVPLWFDASVPAASSDSAQEGPQEATDQRFSLDQFFSSEAGGAAGRRSGA